MSPDGYGKFKVDRKTVRAHRFSLFLSGQQVPAELCVCHSCDVPLCVRPSHLWIGTHLNNIQDRNEKGRTRVAHGASHGMTHLSDAEVLEMRRLRRRGYLLRELASKFGLTEGGVSYICSGKSRIVSTPLEDGC